MDTDYAYKEEADLIGQMLNCFKSAGMPVGLILNFNNPKLEVRRVVASTQNFIKRGKP